MACVFPSQNRHAKEHVTNIAVTSVWCSSKFIQIPGEKSAQDVAVFLGWEVLFETRNLHQALPATPPHLRLLKGWLFGEHIVELMSLVLTAGPQHQDGPQMGVEG